MHANSLHCTPQPYKVHHHPPALLLPGRIPVGTETRRRLKVGSGVGRNEGRS